MKKTGLYKKMLVLAVVPILLLGIVITCFCYFRFTNTLYEQACVAMENIAFGVETAYDLAYEGDYSLEKVGETYELYKGDNLITTDYSIVDAYAKAAGMDISLLYKDMRVHTTFTGTSGARLSGISTNPDTAMKVLFGEEVFYKNVTLINEEYLVLYVPVKNSDGEIAGMIEVAKSAEDMKKMVLKAVWPILLIAAVGMIAAIAFSLKNTSEITGVLKKLQVFLNKVAGGNLQTELDTELLRRQDELGDISKSSTAMQRSIRSFVETDPLTGLNNRRYVTYQLQKIRDRAKDTGLPFAVAIGDIDFFKKVNDTYGHNAGDEVLKAVANQLKSAMQGKGFVARWGGEEFVMVFDKCGMFDAGEHLWKALENIREMVVNTEEGYAIKITMSFGAVDGTQTTIENMVEGADAKLYYAKQHGRNQVVVQIEEELEEEETPENSQAVDAEMLKDKPEPLREIEIDPEDADSIIPEKKEE